MKVLSKLLTGLCLITFLFAFINKNQTMEQQAMRLNAGIITSKLAETKKFYVERLGFGITFENDWFILLHTPDHSAEISFLQPNHPTQAPIFQPAFNGKGVYITIEVPEVDVVYKAIKEKKVPIEVDIKDEVWGDRHFAIVDPNGIGIDFVTHKKQ